MRTLNEIISNLNDEQKQLLADTIKHGYWGDCEMVFDDEEAWCDGYITNDAYKGGHFERRTLSNKFRGLLAALKMNNFMSGKTSKEICWAYDWWGDGSGSVLFIRSELSKEFEQWAKNYNKQADLLGLIKQARESKGYSQERTARESGMTTTNYARIERGEAGTTMATLERIAKTLGYRLTLEKM